MALKPAKYFNIGMRVIVHVSPEDKRHGQITAIHKGRGSMKYYIAYDHDVAGKVGNWHTVEKLELEVHGGAE